MKKQLVNHFVICLDKSGSMQPIQHQAVDAVNDNVAAIKAGAYANGQRSTITLVTFGGHVARRLFCEPVDAVSKFEYRDYTPLGGTPLLDAVGRTITDLCARNDAEDDNVSFVFIVITDGEENSSCLTPKELQRRMAEVQKTDRWSFAFLLPPGSSKRFCSNYGIPEGNVKEWEATAKGVEGATRSVNTGISSYYATRSAGNTSTQGFFTTGITKATAGKIKKSLSDIRSLVKIAPVSRTATIRDFIENSLRVRYTSGHAFYQLVKSEKVQHHKKIMLRERGNDAVYAGDDARHLLGLPDGLDVNVRPGSHANWDIFVQSTSVNRKLLPGTQVAYLL